MAKKQEVIDTYFNDLSQNYVQILFQMENAPFKQILQAYRYDLCRISDYIQKGFSIKDFKNTIRPHPKIKEAILHFLDFIHYNNQSPLALSQSSPTQEPQKVQDLCNSKRAVSSNT